MSKISFEFTAKVWIYSGKGAWHFVSVPEELSAEIRTYFKEHEQGWGRLASTAKIGSTEWKGAVWFDSKKSIYLLPIKAIVRKKELINAGDEVNVFLYF